MRIGIALTTRNRPYCFHQFISHLLAYMPENDFILSIVDDCSTEPVRELNKREYRRALGTKAINPEHCHYTQLSTRHGVARAKNAALAYVRECDWIFLFEDDCWPIVRGWDRPIIDCAMHNNCECLNACHPGGFANEHLVRAFGGTNAHALLEVANSTGYMMLFSGHALATLGGYDARCGICGGEDTQMNLRQHKAGFKPAPYCGPMKIGDWIYSVDLDWTWAKTKTKPPLGKIELCEGSCLSGGEKSIGWAAGAKYVHDGEIYKEPEV